MRRKEPKQVKLTEFRYYVRQPYPKLLKLYWSCPQITQIFKNGAAAGFRTQTGSSPSLDLSKKGLLEGESSNLSRATIKTTMILSHFAREIAII